MTEKKKSIKVSSRVWEELQKRKIWNRDRSLEVTLLRLIEYAEKEEKRKQIANGHICPANYYISLVLDNDQGTYSYILAKAAEILKSDSETKNADMEDFLRDFLEEEIEKEDISSLLISELIDIGMSELDLYELARHYLTRARENIEFETREKGGERK